MKRPIKDKIKGEKDDDEEEDKGFTHIRNAMIKAIKSILAAIRKNYKVIMDIRCKIAGIGTVARYEYLKSDIEKEEIEDSESSRKIVELLKNRIEKAKDRIIKIIEAQNLTNLTLTASTEKIPYINWITDVNITVTIEMISA